MVSRVEVMARGDDAGVDGGGVGVGLVSESGASWWTGSWVVGAVEALRKGAAVLVGIRAAAEALQGSGSPCRVEVWADLRGGGVEVGGGACGVDNSYTPSGGLKSKFLRCCGCCGGC